jgi:hypothetical protein
MTWRARIFALFPACWLASLLACVYALAAAPGWRTALAPLFVAYLLPVLCFRLHGLAWPLREGRSRIDAPGYSPWWGSHQFQVMYNAFPALESALRLVPGLYSAWLRLWGSRVGRRVHWTPRVEIADRSLLEIGDDVVFGHLTACYAHLIKPRRDGLLLYVRRIRIGSRVFLGAGSRLGPGASIADGTVLEILTDVGVGRRLDGGNA